MAPRPALNRVSKLGRSKVHPALLKGKLLVDIAIRRKSTAKKGTHDHRSPKLHLKLLEAGLRIRLILCPSMYELYRQLTPHNSRKNSLVNVHFSDVERTLKCHDILRVLKGHRGHNINYSKPHDATANVHEVHLQNSQEVDSQLNSQRNSHQELNSHGALPTPVTGSSEDRSDGLVTPEGVTEDYPYLLYSGKSQCRRVRLIDSNLVNISRVSNKVLKTFAENNPLLHESSANDSVSTFNQLDTAVSSLFNVQEYSLVRVTRSASSSSSSGSVLMKLETARRGDFSLVDDREFMDDMLASLGNPGERPNNIFIKKVVARPRYKSDMKIYIIPSTDNMLLYADERMLERDLVNGVIDMDTPPVRKIYTTFPADEILARVRTHLDMSKDLADVEYKPVGNHVFGDILLDIPGLADSVATTDSVLSGSVSSSLSVPSVMSSALTNSENSSVSTPSYGDIQYIPNAKEKPQEHAAPLKFDTDYAA